MSRDCVRFTIMASNFHESGDKIMKLIQSTLGATLAETMAMRANAEHFGLVEVICRPSQFARFLINRAKFVRVNRFQELKAVLFVPEPDIEAVPVYKLDKRQNIQEL